MTTFLTNCAATCFANDFTNCFTAGFIAGFAIYCVISPALGLTAYLSVVI